MIGHGIHAQNVTWYDEIFGENEKEHYSDFDLADFCRGGDLTED